jgi:DNA-binding NtrC family response regulator
MKADASAILVVEDDLAIAKVLVALLRQEGHNPTHVSSAEHALSTLFVQPFDLVLSDIRMSGMDGLALLKQLASSHPELPVVLLTAHGSVQMAVEAMKAGAADFMLKPFDRDELLFVVHKALARSTRARTEAPALPTSSEAFVGHAPAMNVVFATIQKVASSAVTVLIRGETGTGKELVAKALHEQGARHDQPFIRVHCAALPEALLESELFGYEKGAFTGATQRKPGRIELAHRGTLFLDEIGDIAPQVQVKLLRVLQEREFERLGGTQTIKVDVRFVAATHRNLEAMVAAGTFREDLFYRLNVVPITVPALRERACDIAALSNHFASTLGTANGRPNMVIAGDAQELLATYAWPGNVRQLQNLVERLVVLSDQDRIRSVDVERELGAGSYAAHANASSVTPEAPQGPLHAQVRELEREALLSALARSGNNRTLAARLLNVSRRTLYNKLTAHGLA